MTNIKSPFGDEARSNSETFFFEEMIVNIQAEIHQAMVGSDISQKELSERLGCSPARVSQYLSHDGRNLNLKTLAKIIYALGLKISLDASVSKLDKMKTVHKQAAHKYAVSEWESVGIADHMTAASGANDNRVITLYEKLSA